MVEDDSLCGGRTLQEDYMLALLACIFGP
ncbi:protein of unknown function [Listeria monocytogenes R479a]|nr:protein of unknown function [Listeria monocytogenes R479a]